MASALVKGRTFFITGSTDGIGRHTAKKIASEFGKVIVHGRTQTKVDDTVQEIKRETGNPDVFGYVYDLSSIQAVHQLAAAVRKDHQRIDVFVNNAGVFERERRVSPDGFELTWAVNVLAPFILQCSLLDIITSRLINVSSISAASSINFGNLQQNNNYDMYRAYSQSKLCVMMFTFHLAKRLKSRSDMTVNCLDPGTVNTKMLKSGWGSFGLSPSQADDEFFLATNPNIATVTSEYFVRSQITRPPLVARDRAAQTRLWKILEEQSGISLDL